MPFTHRPQISSMKPYSPGKPIDEVKRELGLTHVVKLASNENPLGPSPKAVEAAKKAAETMHLYPDASGHAIRSALASKWGLELNQVAVGNGSDELIHYIGQVMLGGEDSELLIGDPTFVRYEASGQLAASRVVKVTVDSRWAHDVQAMADRITPATKVVYVANPNNPTGAINRLDEIEWLAWRIPSGTLLVIDEAYYEYAVGAEGYGTGIDLLKAGAPVAVLRTFSKAFGLAGLRLGWGAMPTELLDLIDRVREPFNVNALAQAAAIAALEDDEHLAKSAALNEEGLRSVGALAAELGLKVVDSHANFACIDLGRPAQPVFEALLKLGIIARSGHVLGMPNHLRVSIGTPEELRLFGDAFRTVMAG